MQPRKIGPDVGFRQPGQVGNEAAVTISSRVGSRSSTFTAISFSVTICRPVKRLPS